MSSMMALWQGAYADVLVGRHCWLQRRPLPCRQLSCRAALWWILLEARSSPQRDPMLKGAHAATLIQPALLQASANQASSSASKHCTPVVLSPARRTPMRRRRCSGWHDQLGCP